MAELLVPNVNFVPALSRILLPGTSAMWWGMSELGQNVSEMGFDGVELHYSAAFLHCRELLHAAPEEIRQAGLRIIVGHESWKSTEPESPSNDWPRRDTPKPGPLQRAIGYASSATLPNGPRSLNKLRAIERQIGQRFNHYVLFPKQRAEQDRERVRFLGECGIQPTIDVAATWNAANAEAFVGQLGRHGLQAIWDSFHGDRPGSIVDTAMRQEDYVPTLLRHNRLLALQISAARVDFAKLAPGRYAESLREAEALLGKREFDGLRLGDLFAELRNNHWQGDVTLELPLLGLAKVLGKPPNRATMISAYRDMGQAIRSQLPQNAWRAA
jgi:hypothetical protein